MRTSLSILLLLAGSLVVAAQEYTLQVGNVTWIGSAAGYNPFSTTAYPNTVNLTITKQVIGARRYAVTAGPSVNTGNYNRRLTFGGGFLNYELYVASDLAQILRAPPVATAAEVIDGASRGRPGTVIPLSFVFFIPPNQLAAPGNYTDQVTISVYRRYNDPMAPQDTQTISINAVVAATAALCLVPTGSGFDQASTSQTFNFGTLAQGQTRTCDLLVRKNTSCTVTFVSANRGVLKRVPPTGSDQVAYTFRVDGTLLDLSSTAILTLPSGVSPTQDGTRLPMVVTIGNPGDAAAGDYRDEITITVTVQ